MKYVWSFLKSYLAPWYLLKLLHIMLVFPKVFLEFYHLSLKWKTVDMILIIIGTTLFSQPVSLLIRALRVFEPNRNMRMAKIYSERLEFPTKNILIPMLALEGPYFLHSWLIQADGRAYFISAGYLTVFCLQSWTYVEKKSLQGRRKVNDAR